MPWPISSHRARGVFLIILSYLSVFPRSNLAVIASSLVRGFHLNCESGYNDVFLIVISSSQSPFSGLGHTPLTATAAMPAAHMKIYRGEPVDNRIAENVKIGKSRNSTYHQRSAKRVRNLGKTFQPISVLSSFCYSIIMSRSRGPLDSRGEHRQPKHLRHAHLRVHGQGRPRVVRAETDQRRGVSKLASHGHLGWR